MSENLYAEEVVPEGISMVGSWIAEYDRAWEAKKMGTELAPPTETNSVPLSIYCTEVRDRLGDGNHLSEELINDVLVDIDELILLLDSLNQLEKFSQDQKSYIAKRLQYFRENFKRMYPPDICQLYVVIPFTNYGNKFSDEELGKKEFLKRLYVMSDGLTYGHTPTPAYYSKSIPSEIMTHCSFVPKYANESLPLPSLTELHALRDQIQKAFTNLMKILIPDKTG